MQDITKEKISLAEELSTSRKEKASVDEQLTETFFSLEQMKTEWASKESEYCHKLERYASKLALLCFDPSVG
jgi:chromosome segregation ATPase